MTIRQPRYSKEEAARRGDEIYDRDVRSHVEPQHNGEVVAISDEVLARDAETRRKSSTRVSNSRTLRELTIRSLIDCPASQTFRNIRRPALVSTTVLARPSVG